MKILFFEHPRKALQKQGYCSYYGEIFYALQEVMDITFASHGLNNISELSQYGTVGQWDAIILGFGHGDVGDGNIPAPINQDTKIPLFPILNKEYTGLEGKLNWIKSMNATAALTVQHEVDKFTGITGIPFHRIMWSCDENLFKDYGDDYSCDLFYSGVVRPEQHNDFRNRIFQDLSKLDKYKLCINARHQKNNYHGTIYSPQEYAKRVCSSKIVLTTPSPANLVNPRYFECMASNRALVLCSRVEDDSVYSDMIKEDENCVMFSTEDEFFDKAIYYLENEDERMKIVNQAYNHFTNSLTWKHRAQEIKLILEQYIK